MQLKHAYTLRGRRGACLFVKLKFYPSYYANIGFERRRLCAREKRERRVYGQ